MTPREIALSICEPWFNGDPCEGCKCHKVCTKLVDRIAAAIQSERSADPGKTSDHIPDATKMVPTINEMETVEPVAYVTGYRDGFCVINPVEHVVFPTGMALYMSPPNQAEDALGMVEPVAYCTLEQLAHLKLTVPSKDKIAIYTAPPTREPLTEEQIEFRFGRKPTRYMMFLIRSTERAHGIGGEE